MGEDRRRAEAEGKRGRLRRSAAVLAAIAIAAWGGAGVRSIDAAASFGVVDGPAWLGYPERVDGGVVWAPPGLARLSIYPKGGKEVELPSAEHARLLGSDGSLFGFRGFVTVRARPEAWRVLHAAAGGEGLRRAVWEAVREAGAGLSEDVASRLGLDAVRTSLSRALTETLASRGLDLRRLDLDAVDALTAEAGEIERDPDTRLLIVGLDGLDWEIADPLIDAGRMPNLASLVERGARGKLLTISPMLSPVIWTTVATGVEPRRHGILDFLIDGPDGTRVPVTSDQRTAPTFWELLGDDGISAGIVAWWATWPATPVEGYLVADRVAYQLFDFRADPDDAEGKTWPGELYEEEVRSRLVPPETVPWSAVEPFVSGAAGGAEAFDEDELELIEELRTLLASERTYMGIATHLAAERRPRLEIVYLEGTDTIGHLFMPYRPPKLEGVSGERIARFGNAVDRYYEHADRLLGRLLDGKGEDWTVLVLSDHGFATDQTRPIRSDSRIGHGGAANWHRKFGAVVLSGRNIRPGVRLENATVYDIAPTVLALFGHPVPDAYNGRVLADAIDPAFFREFPVRYWDADLERNIEVAFDAANPNDPDLMAKLESLGYVGAVGSEAEGASGGAVTLRNNAGVALLAEGKLREAEALFRDALREFPDQPMLHVNLGLSLRLQGRVDEAIEVLERVAEAPQAVRMVGQHLTEIALEQGRLDDAEAYARRALEAEPDASAILTALANVYLERDDLEAAADLFRKAVDVDPNAARARNQLGNLARRAGDVDAAERWYLEAIEADPYFMGAYNNLALVYQDRGELDRAIDLYARALERAASDAVVMNNLASLYYQRGDIEDAVELWNRCIRVRPGYASPYNNLAGVEMGRDRDERALQLLRRALEIDPEYGDARVNLATILRRRGAFDEARHQLERAAMDERARSEALRQLGVLELDAGNPEAAVRTLQRLVAESGETPSRLNALGEAYWRIGMRADALETWERSLVLDPTQAYLEEQLERLERQGSGHGAGEE